MRADDVYRFAVLRHVAGRPPGDLAEPFIPAYGTHEASPDDVRTAMTSFLAQGDLPGARDLAQGVVADGANAWGLIGDDALDAALRGLVPPAGRPSGPPQVVRDWVSRPLTEADEGEARQRLASQRGLVATARRAAADLLTAYAVVGGGADGDGAAFIVCACEALERLLDGVEDRLSHGSDSEEAHSEEAHGGDPEAAGVGPATDESWLAPLTSGVVVLPYDLRASSTRPAPVDRLAAFRPTGEIVGDDSAGWSALGPPPSFVGDLIVLKQQLRRYSLGEIAHVENVMAKEHLSRTFRTLRRDETRLLSSTDTEKEVSFDSQTTTRDELRTEIDSAMSEQLDLSASFNVQATYLGPSITVAATVGAAVGYRRASEERTSTATAHTQEVVSKASERIRERTMTEREQIELFEREDSNTHGFTNDTAEHLVGVYRWLEKEYDLHLVNYGRRRIFEFAVPEPAAFWAAATLEQGAGLAGPRPRPPQLGAVPHDLGADDLSLRAADGTALDQPALWPQIVALASQWEVALPEPPAPARQVHYVLQVPGEASSDTAKDISRFGNNQSWFYESGVVSRLSSQEPVKIPDGYAATSGSAAAQGFMYVRKRDNSYKQFERGYGFIYFNGRLGWLSSGVSPGDGTLEVTFPDGTLVPAGTTLEGDIPLGIATTLNGLALTIRLDCVRTARKERDWVDAVLAAFGQMHAQRVADWEEEGRRAAATDRDRNSALPEATMRAIEKRELKRAILSQMTRGAIDVLGDAVLPAAAASGPLLPPAVRPDRLDLYRRAVRFFEQVFDWGNIAYAFVDYNFARQARWSELATLSNADAQFRAFLAAGGARVQLPVRLGYETHAEYFFSDLIRDLSLDARLPWLASMTSIAEDLAADAREGFTTGAGRLGVVRDDAVVTGSGTGFSATVDTGRELRVGGLIYVIEEVLSATEVRLRPPYQGDDATRVTYELGGIVVGDPVPLSLPTTLIAIDTEVLVLPTFPPRYASA